MKLLLLPSFFFLFISLTNKNERPIPRKLTIIYNNDLSLRPIATGIKEFWASTEYQDTVQINSERIATFFVNEVSRLKNEGYDYSFSVNAAIIFQNEKNEPDTVYTDRFFHDFLIKGITYSDISKEKELRKMFGGFFMFQYEK